jgi:CIC family chloride channel protein
VTNTRQRIFDHWTQRARDYTSVGFTRLRAALGNESQLLFTLTIAIGALCGFAAVLFHLAIDRAQSLLIDRALHKTTPLWWLSLIALPTLGGIIVGALLRWVVPGARGSGIPQVKKAFALDAGRVPFGDAVGKFILTTIQVGSGASLGREGPTVQICAGIASLLARAARLAPKNMRRLTPVGVAAGIAAAFNAPIAAVTFTIEEIVGRLDHSVLSGVVVAAALAAVIERGILGVHPMIAVEQAYGLDAPSSLITYGALGVFAAMVSVLFTDGLLWLRAAFRRQQTVPNWLQPAVGGLVTGTLAAVALATLNVTGVSSGSYSTLHRALAGQLTLAVLLVLLVLKIAATVASYSSGGAGGVFAPSLFIGAMLGGAVGHLDVALFHHGSRALGSFALVGMGAVFAGVIRAPITSVLIIFEMTGAYGLVLPLMIANATAYVLARRWRATPLYEALLAQDGVTLPDAEPTARHALDALTVRDAMTRDVVVSSLSESVSTVRERLRASSFSALPVLDEHARIVGSVTLDSLTTDDDRSPLRARMEPAVSISESAPLIDAIVTMNDRAVRHVFAVSTAGALVGVLTISDVVRAHAQASPRATDSARLSLTRSPPEKDASIESLAADAPSVTTTTRVDTVLSAIEGASCEACVVLDADGAPIGVVTLPRLREFVRDRQLQRMLFASDVTQPAAVLAPSTPIRSAMEAIVDSALDAVIVGGHDGGPARVLTRATLAEHALNLALERGSSPR